MCFYVVLMHFLKFITLLWQMKSLTSLIFILQVVSFFELVSSNEFYIKINLFLYFILRFWRRYRWKAIYVAGLFAYVSYLFHLPIVLKFYDFIR